jgi:hypothetical protein
VTANVVTDGPQEPEFYNIAIQIPVPNSTTIVDGNLPGMLELCQQAASGTGTNGNVSTDVLVTTTATPVTQASAFWTLNSSFVLSRDCINGLQTTQTLSLDSSGNATFNTWSGPPNSSPTIVSSFVVLAASFTAALQGTPYTVPSQSGQYMWSAYQYPVSGGGTRAVIVERGTNGGNYVAVWYY